MRVLESGWRRRTKNLDAFRSQQRNMIFLLIVIVLKFILFEIERYTLSSNIPSLDCLLQKALTESMIVNNLDL